MPGRYSITNAKTTLWSLIQRAGGLVEGHAKNIEIVRATPERSKSLHLMLEDEDLSKSFLLFTGDSILTYHQSRFQDETTIKVKGFVRDDIEFPFSDSLTLLNVLQRSGGLRDGAMPYVYIKKTDDKKNIRYEKIGISEAGEYLLERRD